MADEPREPVLYRRRFRLAVIAVCFACILFTAALADTLREVAVSIALGLLLALIAEAWRGACK